VSVYRFRCARFPEGTAHIRTRRGDIVTFVDGHAEVHDPDVAEALRAGVLPVFGIVEEGAASGSPATSSTPEGKPARPSVRASKAEWVRHAARAYDVPRDVAESMTKAELIELYGE